MAGNGVTVNGIVGLVILAGIVAFLLGLWATGRKK